MRKQFQNSILQKYEKAILEFNITQIWESDFRIQYYWIDGIIKFWVLIDFSPKTSHRAKMKCAKCSAFSTFSCCFLHWNWWNMALHKTKNLRVDKQDITQFFAILGFWYQNIPQPLNNYIWDHFNELNSKTSPTPDTA